MIGTHRSLRVADEAWVALALLHRHHPHRDSFSSREIFETVKKEAAHPDLRPGIQPHVSLHNVANIAANSARYRMFYRTPDGKYRLFRPGDDYHPSRTGKTKPERSDLPEPYRGLLDWYETSYCGNAARGDAAGKDDSFLAMRGVGKEIWRGVDADKFVASLRAGWDRGRGA